MVLLWLRDMFSTFAGASSAVLFAALTVSGFYFDHHSKFALAALCFACSLVGLFLAGFHAWKVQRRGLR